MTTIDTAPGLTADVARIKRIEQLERELSEANEYARKLSIKVLDLGGDIQRLQSSLHQWRKLAGMLIELQSGEYPAGGEAMIDQERDARDLYRQLKEGVPFDDMIQRLKDAGGRLFEELDDKTPEPNCRCHVFPPCSDCTNHASSREALKEWKEANK